MSNRVERQSCKFETSVQIGHSRNSPGGRTNTGSSGASSAASAQRRFFRESAFDSTCQIACDLEHFTLCLCLPIPHSLHTPLAAMFLNADTDSSNTELDLTGGWSDGWVDSWLHTSDASVFSKRSRRRAGCAAPTRMPRAVVPLRRPQD